MRKWVLALGCILVLGLRVGAQEAEPRAIVDKAVKALGDEKVAKKLLKNIAKAKGTIHIAGMVYDMNVKTWSERPAKTKLVIDLSSGGGDSFELTQVLNGDKAWLSIAGMVMDMDEKDVMEAKEMLYVEQVTGLFTINSDKSIKLASLGDSKVGDKAVVGVKVMKNGKRDVKLFFDKKSNLLVKAEYRAVEPVTKTEVNQEKFFDGYKELVPGLKSATKTTVKNDGELLMELEVTEVQPVDQIDDSVFARPPDLEGFQRRL